jgi:hypothetical protein
MSLFQRDSDVEPKGKTKDSNYHSHGFMCASADTSWKVRGCLGSAITLYCTCASVDTVYSVHIIV